MSNTMGDAPTARHLIVYAVLIDEDMTLHSVPILKKIFATHEAADEYVLDYRQKYGPNNGSALMIYPMRVE